MPTVQRVRGNLEGHDNETSRPQASQIFVDPTFGDRPPGCETDASAVQDLDPERLRLRLADFDDGPPGAPDRIRALIELAWAIALMDQVEARRLSEEAQTLAVESEDARGDALSRRNLAYLDLLGGKLKPALQIAEKTVQDLHDLGEQEAEASIYDILYHCYERIGDFKTAMQYNMQNLELNREIGHSRGEAWGLHNMGSIHSELGELDVAAGYYHQALELFRRIDYPVGESRVHSRLGFVYRSQGRHEEALESQLRSQALAKSLDLDLGVTMAHADIGREYEALGRFDEARHHYELAVAGFKIHVNRASAGETQVRLARLDLQQDRLTEAAEHLELAFAHLEETGANTLLFKAYACRAELRERQGDIAGALADTRASHAHYQKVYDAESRSEIKNLTIRMEMQQAAKDAEIHRLRYVELEGMQAQLLQSERMATLGGLAAGLAHEVNNPLGVIRSNLDLTARASEILRRALPEEAVSARKTKAALDALSTSVSASSEASQRIQKLIESLRQFVRLDESDFGAANLEAGLDSALTLLSAKIPDGVRVTRDFETLPPIQCFASEVNQAFMTLLENAVEAIEDEGEVRIRTRVEKEYARVDIEDTGRGMPAEQLEHLFDLGFDDGGRRVSFYIGLPTAAATVRKHGGDIEVMSEVGKGTCFSLRFPLVPSSTDAVPSPATAP